MFLKILGRVTYANVAMTMTLVFAMAGGAYAAKKTWIITSTKQIKPNVLKQLNAAGPTGPGGEKGAAGPQGAPGTPGKDGVNGERGERGPEGSVGPKGATGTAGPAGTTGKDGATGAAGVTGPEGVCSTSTCHLPANVTLKGVWGVGQYVAKGWGEGGEEEIVYTPISFGVPLAAALDASHVHYIPPSGSPPSGCSGSVTSPGAASGNLCVFAQEISPLFSFFGEPAIVEVAGGEGADKFGARIRAFPNNKGEFAGNGSWAVTG